jgi:hypothetical protein
MLGLWTETVMSIAVLEMQIPFLVHAKPRYIQFDTEMPALSAKPEDQVSCTVAGNKWTSQDTASSEVDIASKLHDFRLLLNYHIDGDSSLF